MAKALPYTNGDLVAVPLREGCGYAVGLISAHDRRGAAIGYFFNQRFEEPPSIEVAAEFGIPDVVRVMRFGDLGLIKGGWLVIGKHPEWAQCEWPMPVFGRREPTGRAFRVVYSSNDLRGPEREEVISDDECDLLPRDALSGSGAVERVLTHLLGHDVES